MSIWNKTLVPDSRQEGEDFFGFAWFSSDDMRRSFEKISFRAIYWTKWRYFSRFILSGEESIAAVCSELPFGEKGVTGLA